METLIVEENAFPEATTLEIENCSIEDLQVAEGCFNGIETEEPEPQSRMGRMRVKTDTVDSLRYNSRIRVMKASFKNAIILRNNGNMQSVKLPVNSFTNVKKADIKYMSNLKSVEVAGSVSTKKAPLQSVNAFVTVGTPSLETVKIGSKSCKEASVFALEAPKIKEVEIGDKCFQGKKAEASENGKPALSFQMNDKSQLISTKIGSSSFSSFKTYELKNNPKQTIATVSSKKSYGRQLQEGEEDLPTFGEVVEVVMANLASLVETAFGHGSFKKATRMTLEHLPAVKNITLEEGSYGSLKELVLESTT